MVTNSRTNAKYNPNSVPDPWDHTVKGPNQERSKPKNHDSWSMKYDSKVRKGKGNRLQSDNKYADPWNTKPKGKYPLSIKPHYETQLDSKA